MTRSLNRTRAIIPLNDRERANLTANLTWLRDRARLTNRALADALDLRFDIIRNWFAPSHAAIPNPRRLRILARFFRLPTPSHLWALPPDTFRDHYANHPKPNN